MTSVEDYENGLDITRGRLETLRESARSAKIRRAFYKNAYVRNALKILSSSPYSKDTLSNTLGIQNIMRGYTGILPALGIIYTPDGKDPAILPWISVTPGDHDYVSHSSGIPELKTVIREEAYNGLTPKELPHGVVLDKEGEKPLVLLHDLFHNTLESHQDSMVDVSKALPMARFAVYSSVKAAVFEDGEVTIA